MKFIRWHFLLYILLYSATIFAQTSIHLISNSDSPRFGQLQISGIEFPEEWTPHSFSQKDWQAVFSVQFGEQMQADLPSMLGKYEVVADTIFFQARFPFTQGKSYTALFEPTIFKQKTALDILNQEKIIYTFQVPIVQKIEPTYVEEIYPSTSVLPMNQLKLYLYFSAEMRAGQAFDHIKLLDEKGAVVQDPFLYMDKELWDKDRKRLTIWFDPGRIKRDLSPNQLLGLPLQAGQSYQLVVDKNCLDINGNPLKQDFVKSFSVVESDRKMPHTAEWKLSYPSPNTKAELAIDFGEAMDYALLQHSLVVLDNENKVVDGEVKIVNLERGWQFIPNHPWKPGHYTIEVATILEDLAGNNLNRLFDRDMRVDAAAVRNRGVVEISFETATY